MAKQTGWHTASPSSETCVEVNENLDAGVAGIQDTEQHGCPDRTVLTVPHSAYAAFISGLKAGDFTA